MRVVSDAHENGRALDSRGLTYTFAGVTLNDHTWRTSVPAGFRPDEASVRLGLGEACWAKSSRAVMAWGVKTRSGFVVQPEGGNAAAPEGPSAGERLWLIANIGPWRIREPIEITGVIDEPRRRGFAYGTLEGHPVSGEELFVVERRDDDSVWFVMRSATGPSTGTWRALFPVLLLAQAFYRRRYRQALVDHP